MKSVVKQRRADIIKRPFFQTFVPRILSAQINECFDYVLQEPEDEDLIYNWNWHLNGSPFSQLWKTIIFLNDHYAKESVNVSSFPHLPRKCIRFIFICFWAFVAFMYLCKMAALRFAHSNSLPFHSGRSHGAYYVLEWVPPSLGDCRTMWLKQLVGQLAGACFRALSYHAPWADAMCLHQLAPIDPPPISALSAIGPMLAALVHDWLGVGRAGGRNWKGVGDW